MHHVEIAAGPVDQCMHVILTGVIVETGQMCELLKVVHDLARHLTRN